MSTYITVDKKLEDFHGRCDKPAKYDIKIFSMVDSNNFYTSNMEVYVGVQPDGPYKISSSPSDVVEHMCGKISGTGLDGT